MTSGLTNAKSRCFAISHGCSHSTYLIKGSIENLKKIQPKLIRNCKDEFVRNTDRCYTTGNQLLTVSKMMRSKIRKARRDIQMPKARTVFVNSLQHHG